MVGAERRLTSADHVHHDDEPAVTELLVVLPHRRRRARLRAIHELLQSRNVDCGRKLPEAAIQPFLPAPRHEQHAVALDPRRVKLEKGLILASFARRHDGELGLPSLRTCSAHVLEGTRDASRSRWRADGGSELHQSLIEVAWRVGGNELVRECPEAFLCAARLDVVVDDIEPREHACDVAIDERRAPAKGDGGDCAGGVATDAGKGLEVFCRGRQLAAVAGENLAGAFVQIARARVIAKTCPVA